MKDDDIDLWHLAYKHRVGLAPLYVGSATAAVSGVTSMLGTGQTAITLGAIAVAGAALIKTRIRDGLRRVYAYTVLGASASWAMTAHEIMPEHLDWTAVTWSAGTIILGAPWWASQRRHTQVKLDQTVKDWPRLAKRIGLGESRLISVTGTNSGYSGKITWPGGIYDVDNVRNMGRQLEGILPGATRGSVRPELDGKSTNSIKFRVITKDPHELAQLWPIPNDLRRGTDHMVTGIREDGEERAIQKFHPEKGARHLLIGGQTESGKSSLVNLVIANDVLSEDVFPIGFDFKQVELTPWKPALGYMTHEVEKARKLVTAIAAPGGAIDRRASIMADASPPSRVWKTEWGPWIDITIDEAKNLLGETDPKFLKLYTRIKTEGRAVGIGVNEATQYPTLEAVGSSQGRQQNRYGFCFRMMDEEGERYVIPGHRVYAERISEDRPGTCYMRDGSKVETAPQRIYYIDDATRDAVVAARAGRTAQLDEATEAAIVALFPEFAERERYEWVPDGTDSGTGTGTGSGTEGEADVDDGDELDGTAGTDEAAEARLDAVLSDDEPDFSMGDVIRLRRDAMTPEQRDQEDQDRETVLAEADKPETPEDQALRKLRTAMIKAGEAGLPAQQLALVSGRKRTWLYDRLNEWAEEGQVKRVKHGHWAWTGSQLVSVDSDAE